MFRILSIVIFCWVAIHTSMVSATESQLSLDIGVMERELHDLINQERQRYGLPKLTNDTRLTMVARQHSMDMAKDYFFSHFNLAGEDATQRAQRHGWTYRKPIDANNVVTGMSENIFMTPVYEKIVTLMQNGRPFRKQYQWKTPKQIVQDIIQGWLNSPAHRANILSSRHERQGIGMAIREHELFITENLF